MINLLKIFKSMDYEDSKTITIVEFRKALKQTLDQNNLQDQEVGMLFNEFDKKRTGQINYQEFLRVVRVSISSYFVINVINLVLCRVK
jgi:Ca2+-binding EF-hand superfamily protein